jgi:DNA/RNA-binding domain of Phe-tRNA-synthetase-like protein
MNIAFEPIIKSAAPELEVILVTADIVNRPTDDKLWAELNTLSEQIQRDYPMEMVNKRPGIAGTRAAYKALGKEPNRYRPSSESMCRRMVKGLGLYRSLAVIDLINLLSVASGHSIGGFDADKIVGDTLTLGAGREGEPYEAIGRGQLNIACLPVFRDEVGGVGTPTSDNDRTKLSEQTTHLVMTINVYRPEMDRDQLIALTERLLTQYAEAKNITFSSHRP